MNDFTYNLILFAIFGCAIFIAVFALVAWKKRDKGKFMNSPEWKVKKATEKWMSER